MDFQKIYSDFLKENPTYTFEASLLLPKLVERGVIDADEKAHIEHMHLPTNRKVAFFKDIMAGKSLECHLTLIQILEEKKLNLLASWLSGRISDPLQLSNQVSLKPSDFINQQYLSQGTFGKVFEAIHRKTNFRVALKKIAVNVNELNLSNEAKMLQSARHSHVVHILGVVNKLEQGEVWIVTEFLNGGSLRPYCTGSESMAGLQKLEIGLHCWSALAYLHNWAKITHKDIKPENILLHKSADTRLIAKLCDFGLAKEDMSMSVTEATALTGTSMYWPPEFGESKRNSQKIDIYSLGATLCELFTNKHFWHDPISFRSFTLGQIMSRLTAAQQEVKTNSSSDLVVDYGPAAIALDQCSDCTDLIKTILRKSVSFNRQKRPSAVQVLEVFQAEFASAGTTSKIKVLQSSQSLPGVAQTITSQGRPSRSESLQTTKSKDQSDLDNNLIRREDPESSLNSVVLNQKRPVKSNHQSSTGSASSNDIGEISFSSTEREIRAHASTSERSRSTKSEDESVSDASTEKLLNTNKLNLHQISDPLDIPLAPTTKSWIWREKTDMSSLSEHPFATVSISDLSHSLVDPRITNKRFMSSYNLFRQETLDSDNQNIANETVLLLPGFPFYRFVVENVSNGIFKHVFENHEFINEINLYDSLIKPSDTLFLSIIQLNQLQGQSEINFQEFDFVININHVYKLFGFCGGLYSAESGFFFDLEKIGETILFGMPREEFIAWQYVHNNIEISIEENKRLVAYQFGQISFLINYQAECTYSTKELDPPLSALFRSDFYKKCKPPCINSNIRYSNFGDDEVDKFIPFLSYDDRNGYDLLDHALFYFTGSDKMVLGKESDFWNTPRLAAASQLTELMKSTPFFEILAKFHDCLLRISNLMASKPDGAKVTIICKSRMEIYDKKPNAKSLLSDDLRQYLQSQSKNGQKK